MRYAAGPRLSQWIDCETGLYFTVSTISISYVHGQLLRNNIHEVAKVHRIQKIIVQEY